MVSTWLDFESKRNNKKRSFDKLFSIDDRGFEAQTWKHKISCINLLLISFMFQGHLNCKTKLDMPLRERRKYFARVINICGIIQFDIFFFTTQNPNAREALDGVEAKNYKIIIEKVFFCLLSLSLFFPFGSWSSLFAI